MRSKLIDTRDTILTVNVVEPGLVKAVQLHSRKMNRSLKGLVLVHKDYAHQPDRPKDSTGLFTEIICDFDNPDELQTVLKPYTNRLLAATCRYEEAMQAFAKVIPFIPYLLTPTETSLVWATEKPLMRDRLSNYDKKLTPQYRYIEEKQLSKIGDLVKGFTFPVIVKPSGLARSYLVRKCNTLGELKADLKQTFKVIHDVYMRDSYPGKPSLLVEEMMEGDMYSVDAYVTADGEIFCLPPIKVATAESKGMPGGFYGYSITGPVELSPAELDAALGACRSSIMALNLRATSTHIELYNTKHGWKIVEVAARIGGHRDDMYREMYGIEHFYNDLAIRMGDKPIMHGEPKAHAVAINVYAEAEGEIISIEGIEEARKLPSMIVLDQGAKVGDFALFASSGGMPICDGVLSNPDLSQLKKDVKLARSLIKIHVKSPSRSTLQRLKALVYHSS